MSANPLRHRRASPRQKGAAAVEFAFLVFLLLVIGAGLVEFGRAMWYYDALAKGSRDAARYLSTVAAGNLGGSGSTTAKSIVADAAAAAGVPEFSSGDVTVSCWPTSCSAVVLPTDVTRVTVSATFPMTLGALFPFLGGGSASMAVTLAPHTTMPYMR